MRRLLSDRLERPAVAGRARLLAAALIALGPAAPAGAQQEIPDTATAPFTVEHRDSIVAASVNVGATEAALELGLSDGRTVQLELDDGIAYADGQSLGMYDEGGGLDRSWRNLLEEAAMASTAELPAVLRAWNPPATGGAVGRQLDERLEQALVGIGGVMVAPKTAARSPEDSIELLLAQIEELEERREHDADFVHRSRGEDFGDDVLEGFAGLIAALVWFGVLLGLGAALLFFAGGRLERVAATAREEPIRSGLVGLAGLFLAFPLWILVILALAISILGIPLILAWMPLFPLLVVLSLIVGWLAVAYVTGDGLVSRKLRERPRFADAGPTQRLALGIAVLLSPFVLAALFQMTSVLEWVAAILIVIGIVGNGLIAAVGFGAVMSHGRDALDRQRERRAARRRARLDAQTPAAEGTNV